MRTVTKTLWEWTSGEILYWKTIVSRPVPLYPALPHHQQHTSLLIFHVSSISRFLLKALMKPTTLKPGRKRLRMNCLDEHEQTARRKSWTWDERECGCVKMWKETLLTTGDTLESEASILASKPLSVCIVVLALYLIKWLPVTWHTCAEGCYLHSSETPSTNHLVLHSPEHNSLYPITQRTRIYGGFCYQTNLISNPILSLLF